MVEVGKFLKNKIDPMTIIGVDDKITKLMAKYFQLLQEFLNLFFLSCWVRIK
jgi:hypothetical protein